MGVIMTYFLIYLISVLVIMTLIEITKFQPTRYWLASKFRLYRMINKIENISKIDIREAEAMLQYLIIMRCTDENRIVNETRNGLRLRFYPEGAEKNKRWVPGDYVAIYHDSCQVCLRVAFDELGVPRFQIEKPHDDTVLQYIYMKSKQGSIEDFFRDSYSRQGKIRILENYRDYLIRRTL